MDNLPNQHNVHSTPWVMSRGQRSRGQGVKGSKVKSPDPSTIRNRHCMNPGTLTRHCTGLPNEQKDRISDIYSLSAHSGLTQENDRNFEGL